MAAEPAWRRRSTAWHVAGYGMQAAALGMAATAVRALVADPGGAAALGASALLALAVGTAARRVTVTDPSPSRRSLFGAVTLLWVAVSAAGALPYVLTGVLGPLDALVESVSGFTCTGSTSIADIESVAVAVRTWRQLTNWLGGLGLVVLAVAVLPYLGVGGLSLLAAEAPGPGGGRLAPRLADATRRMLGVYGVLTAAAAAGFAAAGMGPEDAVLHAMSAVSGGGFSTRAASIGHWDSVAVEAVAIVAMLAGAVSFPLHWRAAHGDPGAYWRSAQLRVFVGIVVGCIGLVVVFGAAAGQGWLDPLREGAFTVVTIVATCGLVAVRPDGGGDYTAWPVAAQLVLLVPFATGGMAGSTAGAIKVLRVQVMAGVARREVVRAAEPRAVHPVVVDGEPVPEEVVDRVIGFVLLYALVAAAGVVALAVGGTEVVTGIGTVLGAMGGSGLGLGEAGPTTNLLAFAPAERGVLGVLMLAGRLEVFALVIGLSAACQAVARRPRPRGLTRRVRWPAGG